MSQSDFSNPSIESFLQMKMYAAQIAMMNAISMSALGTGWPLEYPAIPDECDPAPETVVGYVEGYRWWNAEPGPHGTIRLGSTGVEYIWEWGENVIGESEYDQCESVRRNNSVGFHAFKKDSIDKLGNDFFGRVALYGDVCEHILGYRAEKARILDLWCKPELWEKMQHVPKMRGTFTIEPETCSILDKDGQPFPKGDYSWLTLTTLNELPDTNPSVFPTTRLRIKNHYESYPWMFLNPIQYTMEPRVMPDGRFENSCLFAPPSDKKVIRPDGDYCPICDERIQDHQAVVIEHALPHGEITVAVREGTFAMLEVQSHLDCQCKDTNIWLSAIGSYPSPAFVYNGSV